MRHITFSLFAAGVLACSPAHAAVDLFLCMPSPYIGETTDSGFANCIDVLSVSDAGFHEGVAGSPAGHVAEPRDFRITKYVDSSTVPLRRAFILGVNIDDAILYIRAAGSGGVAGPNGAHISIRLVDSVVTSFANPTGSGEDRSLETVSLRARKIQYMYRRKNGTGQLQPPSYTCWDVTLGTATANPC